MGATLTRGSSLSDDQVIALINKNFVPIELNLSKTGFPPGFAGLKPWERAYKKDWRYRMAFATSVVLNPTGKWALGTSGSGHANEYMTAANYHPQLYSKFLNESRDRFERLLVIENGSTNGMEKFKAMRQLRTDIIQSIKQANNRGHFKRG